VRERPEIVEHRRTAVSAEESGSDGADPRSVVYYAQTIIQRVAKSASTHTPHRCSDPAAAHTPRAPPETLANPVNAAAMPHASFADILWRCMPNKFSKKPAATNRYRRGQ
jgi:hypothetical protein